MGAMDETDRRILVFLMSLNGLKGVGSKTLQKVIREKGDQIASPSSPLDAEFAEGLGDSKICSALDKSDQTWEELEEVAFETLEDCDAKGIGALCPGMGGYPRRLLLNESFPPLLFYKGSAEALNPEKSVAIVGTRKPTDFGARMGLRLSELLAEDGYVIVSGLAIGCDTLGHEGALLAGGATVAVLPTPIDAPVYPKQNQALAQRILEGGGALVSEYPPGMELGPRQLPANLVARDEWQPALSDGIIAVETSTTGGTRHALEHALKTARPVAVFDYSSRPAADFRGDPRFGGNVHYLDERKVSPIFGPETVSAFKLKMDAFRSGEPATTPQGEDELQATLF